MVYTTYYMICLMCHKNFKKLGTHINAHGLTSREYYTKFISPQVICTCGNETKFLNAFVGFSSHCSTRCSSLDMRVQEKAKVTNLKTYGFPSSNSDKTVREKRSDSLIKHLQDPTNMKRRLDKRFKTYTTILDGKTFETQGYEKYFLNDLKRFNLESKDIVVPAPIVKYDFSGKRRTYHADFYIPKTNTLVEIKSEWTLAANESQTLSKLAASQKSGFRTLLLVYSEKGELLAVG